MLGRLYCVIHHTNTLWLTETSVGLGCISHQGSVHGFPGCHTTCSHLIIGLWLLPRLIYL